MPLVLLDGHELAANLGTSYPIVMSMARLGEIPSVKTGRGRVLFNLDRVVEALKPELVSLRSGLALVGAEK